jgi:hypothetical protein
MFKVALGLLLLAHGTGHSLGLLQVFRVATINAQWQGDSWLLSGITGSTVAQAIGVAAWTVALVGFIAAAAVVFGTLPASWWEPVALASSLASLLGLLLFPLAFPTLSTIGALIVDLGVIFAVGWYHWVPADLAS